MTIVEKDESIQITKIETQPFGTNAYIVSYVATGDSILIDAPGDVPSIMDALKETTPTCILITHSHMDHTGALIELKSALGVPIAAHEADADHLPLSPEMLLNDGSIIALGKVGLEVIHTPGHTPGSICFLAGRYLLSGDTIFPGGPGRTNTPGALKQIIESITEKIFVLPDDTPVHPGHGDSTIMKKEKEEFSVFSAKSHPASLCGDVLWLSS